jgi:hypothetical protein
LDRRTSDQSDVEDYAKEDYEDCMDVLWEIDRQFDVN